MEPLPGAQLHGGGGGGAGTCRSARFGNFQERSSATSKEGQQPRVSPCAQNDLTPADASLKHRHTCWPGSRPDSLSCTH